MTDPLHQTDGELELRLLDLAEANHALEGQITERLVAGPPDTRPDTGLTLRQAEEFESLLCKRHEAERALACFAEEMTALYDAALDLHTRLSVSGVLLAVAGWARRLLDAQMVGVYMLDEAGPRLNLAIGTDLQDDMLATSLPLPQTPGMFQALGWQETQQMRTGDGRRILALPLVVAGRLTGRLMLADCIDCEFNSEDIRLARLLAGQAAIALENRKRYDEVRCYAGELERRSANPAA